MHGSQKKLSFSFSMCRYALEVQFYFSRCVMKQHILPELSGHIINSHIMSFGPHRGGPTWNKQAVWVNMSRLWSKQICLGLLKLHKWNEGRFKRYDVIGTQPDLAFCIAQTHLCSLHQWSFKGCPGGL